MRYGASSLTEVPTPLRLIDVDQVGILKGPQGRNPQKIALSKILMSD